MAETASTKHRCPKPGCEVMVVEERLACRTHWYEVPRPLRFALNDAYRRFGLGSAPQMAAAAACIRFLTRREL